MPNTNPRSIAKRGSEESSRRQFAKIAAAFLIVFALTWALACASFAGEQTGDDVSGAEQVCDRVGTISEGMLLEQLSVEQIEEHIELLESELEPVRGELVDATERFVLALQDILAGG